MGEDLSLVSEDELLAELNARYADAVFVGFYYTKVHKKTRMRMKKPPHTDYGVAHLVLNTALDEIERRVEDEKPDRDDFEEDWEEDNE